MLLGGGLEIPFCYNGAENLMKMKILYAHGQPNILNQMKNEVSLVLKLSSNHNQVQSKTMLFMGDFESPAPFNALLQYKAAQTINFNADVWALPHHGASLKLYDGMML